MSKLALSPEPATLVSAARRDKERCAGYARPHGDLPRAHAISALDRREDSAPAGVTGSSSSPQIPRVAWPHWSSLTVRRPASPWPHWSSLTVRRPALERDVANRAH